MVCRDRTHELHSIIAALRATTKEPLPPLPTHDKNDGQSAFHEEASRLTYELQDTSDMLTKLTKLILQRNVFDDHSSEIQEMTLVVKQKLGLFHNKLKKLQDLKDSHRGWTQSQADKHSSTVINTLRTQLMDTTQEFKKVLQTRTQSLQETNQRRSKFTAEPPKLGSALFANKAALEDDESSSSDLHAGGGPGMQLQMQRDGGQAYFQARNDAVRQIEQTINELGGMFQEFARIVADQDELIMRIDDDVETALVNVERGQNELIRYLNRVSGNRNLILKIFAVLFFFILFFGLFILK
jgi:syntaxin 5